MFIDCFFFVNLLYIVHTHIIDKIDYISHSVGTSEYSTYLTQLYMIHTSGRVETGRASDGIVFIRFSNF